jgi:putative ABC transport system ATP-binding protein
MLHCNMSQASIVLGIIMSHPTPWVEAHQLCKQYAGNPNPVLNNVSLSLAQGEFVALMGPSGGGKSTLLNLLGLMDTPTSGTLTLAGQPVHGLNDDQRSHARRDLLGFVFQFFHLLPSLTVLENVQVPALLAGQNSVEVQQRCRGLLEQVGLTHRSHALPAELSGGEMQRVAVARALVNRPKLLLADEPTGNLDSDNSQQVLALLSQLHRNEGLTIVMATHSHEAASVASRIVNLRDGQLLNTP